MRPETVPGVRPIYLKFHPTLGPFLWEQLGSQEQAHISARYREYYYDLSEQLYSTVDQHYSYEARAVAHRALPNLLHAVHHSLGEGEEWAAKFAENVARFLGLFSLRRDHDKLVQHAEQRAGEIGSDTWYYARSNRGVLLFQDGSYEGAAAVFNEVLSMLKGTSSYRHCVTLLRLARCYRLQEHYAKAILHYRQALAVAAQVEPTTDMKVLEAALQTDLADALHNTEKPTEARQAYDRALAIAEAIGNVHGSVVIRAQLGMLALEQGNLPEAIACYREAQGRFHELNEPDQEAVCWHQLGQAYQKNRMWDDAEGAYREAALIKESQGNIVGLNGAVGTWVELGSLSKLTGNARDAEAWYRKAITALRGTRDTSSLVIALHNLADLLQDQPENLREAQQLAEEVLSFRKTIDCPAKYIRNNYLVLANIADRQGDRSQAREYRRLARQTKAVFPPTREELKRHALPIAKVVAAVHHPGRQLSLEQDLEEGERQGWGNLVAAIRCILDGERDEDVLCKALDLDTSMIGVAILQAIVDPNSLAELLPDGGVQSQDSDTVS
jgi:tetratricopeptide (TPR) repeat protein